MISFNIKKEADNALGAVTLVLLCILAIAVNFAIGFGICALCTYFACMFFGFNWSIEFAAGCFFIMVMILWFVTSGRG